MIPIKKVGKVVIAILIGAVVVYFILSAPPPPRIIEYEMYENENFIKSIIEDYEVSGEIGIYHWWTAGGEKEAIEGAVNVFESRYPNIDGKSNGVPGGAGGAMVMVVKTMVQGGNAPGTFQAHPGYEIRPYSDDDLLISMNGVWKYAGLGNRVIEGVAELCKIDNVYYMVPIGVHKTNEIWYNKSMFEQYGVTPPENNVTFEEFWALCDELQSKLPSGKYPLALGDLKGWPGSHAFETFLAGAGMELYESFINGEIEPSQLEPVLENLKKLLNYVPPDHYNRYWYDAAAKVYAGDSAMYIMGGWIKGYFTSRGWEYGEDYGSFSAPGTSDWFGLSIDAFAVPKGSGFENNGIRWAYMSSTPEIQNAFCPAKEAISPYVDTPLSIYNEGTRVLAEELLDPTTKTYPSFTHGTAIPSRVLMTLHPRIQEFTTTPDPDVSRYANLITNSLTEAEVYGGWDIV